MSAGIYVEAEMEVLGSLLANNRWYERVRGLSPADFLDPINGLIFDEIEMMICAGELADAVTLWPRLTELGIWDEKQWRSYLADLLCSLIGGAHLPQLRDKIIADADARREAPRQ